MLQHFKKFFAHIWGTGSLFSGTLLVGLGITVILLLLPTGFADKEKYREAEKAKALILSVDNTAIRSSGLIRSGEQICQIRILSGVYEGQEVRGVNLLSGNLAQDKEFAPGDKAFVSISHKAGAITSVTLIDHARIRIELLLAGLFCASLLLFAGPGGLKAILSFVISVLSVWKILIPYTLRGGDPILCGLLMTFFLTVIIILFVFGPDRRSLVAITGSLLGVLTACLCGILFTRALNIHGAIMPESESLLYAGYQHLHLTRIFMATLFIGASGAMMDLAVDITGGMCEVRLKKPGIGRLELMGSGIRIGQAAMGTMATTLLLAYTGGCLTQLMVFMAQGTPLIYILNYKYVAAEILQTLAGSFALFTVAPFTAIVGGLWLGEKEER